MIFDKKIQYRDGFPAYQIELENYFIDYAPCKDSPYVFLTFENANIHIEFEDGLRFPWAYRVLNPKNISMIGIKPKRINWYREPDLHDFFRDTRFLQLVQSYQKIFLYGGSMGGYGALTFSRQFPGSYVLAYNPISSLHPNLTPWETRFAQGHAQNWDGEFGDAAEALDDVAKAYIVYDPLFQKDRAHVMRLPQDKIAHLKYPFVGHRIPVHLQNIRLLKQTVFKAIDGEIEEWFPRAIRKRKAYAWYHAGAYLALAERAKKYGQTERVEKYMQEVLRYDVTILDMER